MNGIEGKYAEVLKPGSQEEAESRKPGEGKGGVLV